MDMLKITNSEIHYAFSCIKKKYGKSRYKKGGYPKLRVIRKSKKPLSLFGGYNPNVHPNSITLYLRSHKIFKSLCDTLLHEYKHYLLSNCEYENIYNILYKKYNTDDKVYTKHPHEKLARKFAKDHINFVYRKLMKFRKDGIKS
jgi:hypothetical protein